MRAHALAAAKKAAEAKKAEAAASAAAETSGNGNNTSGLSSPMRSESELSGLINTQSYLYQILSRPMQAYSQKTPHNRRTYSGKGTRLFLC